MAPSQTFQEHIHEFRKRLFWVILAGGVSAGIAFAAHKQAISLLQRPLNQPLFYSSPAGGFNFIIRLSVIIGLFITLPVIIYQLLRFVEPALPIRIRRATMLKIIGASLILAILGVLFAYFYMIPESLRFFAGYSSGQIKPLISADHYLNFFANILVTFALAFQIPLIILFINRIKPLKPGRLLRYQRHVIVAAFVLSLILPFTYDPISQFMVAVPIIFLYYLSVGLLFIANRGKDYGQSKAKAPKPLPMHTHVPVKTNASSKLPTPMRPALSVDGMLLSSRSLIQPKTPLAKPSNNTYIQHEKPAPSLVTAKKQKRYLSVDGFVTPSTYTA